MDQSRKKVGIWENEAKKLFGIKKEVEIHGDPSNLATPIINLQKTLAEKDKKLKETKTSRKELSYQVTVV